VRASLAAGLVAASLSAGAEAPPPQMMANVYRLTEAAAVLTVCVESPAFASLAPDKAAQVRGQVGRIAALVANIARYYKDATLPETHEATRKRIAGEPQMQGYAKGKYQYCGDALLRDMEAYVAENETLINGYIARDATAPRAPKGK
jgi:hypothetical protein